MPYFEKIPGERIYLSPMNPDDAETYTKWMNDPEVIFWLDQASRVYTLPSERAWLETCANQTGKNMDQYNFAIVLREGERLLGNIGLMNIHPVHRTATFGMFIGEAEDRSCGYGTEALGLLLSYSFRWLGLRNIDLHVDSENARAIRCYEKVGFKEYGCRSQAIFYDGQWHDRIFMEILAENWLAQKRE